MPNRVLRDWTDSFRIERLSVGAERFFARLIMKADDFGRYHADPRLLRAACFPLLPSVNDSDISTWLAECKAADLVFLYSVGGRKFLSIIEFRQRTRQDESKFPPPKGRPTDWLPMFSDLPLSDRCPSSAGQLRTGTETETETETGAETDDGGESGRRLPDGSPNAPPEFEPLRKGLFRREYEAMLRDCDAEIKRIKQSPLSFESKLSKEACELVAFLMNEKRDGWETKVRDIQQKQSNYVRTKLTQQAHVVIAAWERRKAEIRKAMNGVK